MSREREPSDPRAIRSIAVTGEDLVTALEANLRSDREMVFRVTPPFAGRMRARLHAADVAGEYDDADPLYVAPERLVTSDCPPYPEVDETADRHFDGEEYSVEDHRERHVSAVRRWREAVRDHAADRVAIDTDEGPHEVEVKLLG